MAGVVMRSPHSVPSTLSTAARGLLPQFTDHLHSQQLRPPSARLSREGSLTWTSLSSSSPVPSSSWSRPVKGSFKLQPPTIRVRAAVAGAADATTNTFKDDDDGEQLPPRLHNVVIVGGGIAGLATALALHRLGIKSVLVEQSDRLRTAGSAIGIWTNAWRALEALGVAEGLRHKFTKLEKLNLQRTDGSLLLSMKFKDAPRDIELRGVERKALLEALREPLPNENVLYDARVIDIQSIDGGYTEVELQNGTKLQTKVLVGCDGVGSIVARWMGFKEPRYVGYTAIRGLAEFPEGHKFENGARQLLGRGIRAGFVPMDSNRVYWFVVFNTSSDQKVTDPEMVRKEALSVVEGWEEGVREVIVRSPLESLSRRGIADRWMWPLTGPSLSRGGVTLAGDAMHPMTPNLGQGGCCALEDAIVLARALANVFDEKPKQAGRCAQNGNASRETGKVELALRSYTEERWHRVFPLTVRSFGIGALMQLDFDIVCAARDLVLPKIVKLERFVDHTFYDCGTLS